MSNRKRNLIIEEFIELYKSEPCLWRVKSKDYHDRALRDAAYNKLVAKLKESEPDAIKDTVVKKINNLRSNYRKEKKKFDASKKSGAATDDLYKPTLWYYDLFDFLRDQDSPTTSFSNLADEERSESDNENSQGAREAVPHFYNVNEASSSLTPMSSNKRALPNSRPNFRKKHKSEDVVNDEWLSVRDHFIQPETLEDRYDLFGKTVAMKLRGLEKRQRLIAEKIINDTLFKGELDSLSLPMRHYVGH